MTYRIRRSVALAVSATAPVVAGLVLGVIVGLLLGGTSGLVAGTVLAVTMWWQTVRAVRRRTLSLHDDVLVVQRDRYRLVVPWHAITAVQRRRHQWLMDVEELVCSGGRVEAIDSRGRASAPPKGLDQHPALTRVMVSLYAKDWRDGPIGDKVRELGIDS